jgi:hypothetical protein
MKRYLFAFVVFLQATLLTKPAFCKNWTVDFGPFAGTGATSDPEKIRHATGISFAVSRTWALTNHTSIGPVVQLINSFVSARSESEGKRSISTFDHRVASGGVVINQSFGSNQPSLFLAALLGKGMTKLAIDESSANSFLQFQNAGVPLTYGNLEVGTSVPVGSDDNAIKVSVLGSNYIVDQSGAVATVSREERTPNGIELRSETVSAEAQNLRPKANQKIAALKIGLAMGF